jgi:hypothetical protein
MARVAAAPCAAGQQRAVGARVVAEPRDACRWEPGPQEAAPAAVVAERHDHQLAEAANAALRSPLAAAERRSAAAVPASVRLAKTTMAALRSPSAVESTDRRRSTPPHHNHADAHTASSRR